MNPCELNAIITAITNHLFSTLSKKDFYFLTVIFSELSKSMFSIALLRDICEAHHHHHEKPRDHKGKRREKDTLEEEILEAETLDDLL